MLVTGIGRKAGGGKRWTLLAMRLLVLFAASFSMAWAVPAEAKRVALIIANSAYHRGSGKSLFNVGVDGPKVEAALKAADFDVVKLAPNLGLTEFGNALAAFQQEAMGADVALIYYAGHGIQTPAGKFAIPVDADIPSELTLSLRAINVDIMIGALSGARASILVLDACRTNGFADTWGTATRSAQFSFSTDIESTQRNLLALYSAMPGQEARDGNRGEGSPFANAFVRYIQEPGLELTQLAPRIAQAVEKDTSNLQTPTSSGSMAQVIVLKQRAPRIDPEQELYDWEAATREDTKAAYEQFVAKYPDSERRERAEFYVYQIEKRQSQQPATASQPNQSAPDGEESFVLRPATEEVSAGPAKIEDDYVQLDPVPDNSRANLTPIETQPSLPETGPPITTPTPAPAPLSSGSPGHSGGNGPTSGRSDNPERATGAGQPAVPPAGLANNPGGNTGNAGARFDTSPATPPSAVRQPTANESFVRTNAPSNQPPVTTAIGGGQCGYEADQLTAARNRGENPCGDTKRFRPTKDQKQPPEFPAPPKFSDASYPACRNEYLSLPGDFDKLNSLKACLEKLSQYREKDLNSFVATMNTFLGTVSEIYLADMKLDEENYYYSPETQNNFTAKMKDEHVKGKAGGEYMQAYEATSKRQADDWTFLSQEFQTINARYLSQTRQ